MSQNLGNKITTVSGLGTFTHVIENTALFDISCYSTLEPGSALVITINQNGTPMKTSGSPVPNAPWLQTEVKLSCTAGDTITIVLTSSSVSDSIPDAVKSTMGVVLI